MNQIWPGRVGRKGGAAVVHLTALTTKNSVDRIGDPAGRVGRRWSDGGRDQATVLDFLSKGHPAAFWQVWEAHRDYLYAICLRQMGGVREDAEDALSRAMLKAHDKLPRHAAGIANLKAWLTRLVRNLCIDIHRERRSVGAWVEVEEITATEEMRKSQARRSPEDLLLGREIYTYLVCTVQDLPERLREPFILRFFEEMAYPEIAKRLTLTQENVRKRIQIAREILRERIRCRIAD